MLHILHVRREITRLIVIFRRNINALDGVAGVANRETRPELEGSNDVCISQGESRRRPYAGHNEILAALVADASCAGAEHLLQNTSSIFRERKTCITSVARYCATARQGYRLIADIGGGNQLSGGNIRADRKPKAAVGNRQAQKIGNAQCGSRRRQIICSTQ